jgi:hypothetical protein
MWDMYYEGVFTCEQYGYNFKGIQKVAIASRCFCKDTWEYGIIDGRVKRTEWVPILKEQFADLKLVVAALDTQWRAWEQDALDWHKIFAQYHDLCSWRADGFPKLQFYEGMLQTYDIYVPEEEEETETEDSEDKEVEVEGEEHTEVEVGENEEILR